MTNAMRALEDEWRSFCSFWEPQRITRLGEAFIHEEDLSRLQGRVEALEDLEYRLCHFPEPCIGAPVVYEANGMRLRRYVVAGLEPRVPDRPNERNVVSEEARRRLDMAPEASERGIFYPLQTSILESAPDAYGWWRTKSGLACTLLGRMRSSGLEARWSELAEQVFHLDLVPYRRKYRRKRRGDVPDERDLSGSLLKLRSTELALALGRALSVAVKDAGTQTDMGLILGRPGDWGGIGIEIDREDPSDWTKVFPA